MPLFNPRAFDDRGREVTYLDPMTYGSQLDRATRERVNRRKDPRLRQLLLFGAIIVIGLVPQILRLLSGSFPGWWPCRHPCLDVPRVPQLWAGPVLFQPLTCTYCHEYGGGWNLLINA